MEERFPHLDTEQEDTPTNIRLGVRDFLTGALAFAVLLLINGAVGYLFWLAWIGG